MNIEDFLKIGSMMSLKDGNLLIGYGPREWLPQPGTFYFPDYFLERKNPWCTHEEMHIISRDDLIEQLRAHHREVTPVLWNTPTPDPFFEAFEEVNSGRLKKIVPYVMTTSTDKMTTERLCHCLLHTLFNGTKLHLYGYWGSQGGILGATPELLFRLKENQLETEAIAGTATLERDPADFLNDEKERHEHQLVIDGIVESLRPFGTTEVGETGILPLKMLSHLKTPIKLELHGLAEFASLVTSLHPTPALGAFPKEEGMRWLRDYNTRIPRKHFGAPMGCCHGSEITCIVAIRNVQWTPHALAIGAGCGVIPQSQQEQEWNEVQLKTEAVQQTLGFKTSTLPKALSKVLSTLA